MSRTFWAALVVAATTATVLTVGSSPANASDIATSGCTRLFAEYTSNANGIHVSYLEASNICAPYKGWFIVGGAEGPETNPIQTFRRRKDVQVRRGVGGFDCAESFERKADGSFVRRDEVCIRYP